MKIKFNDNEFFMKDFDDGKIIVEFKTSEAFYIEDAAYELINLCMEEYVELDKITDIKYDEIEIQEFISELIENNILITIEG
ncbi:hypothetical protein ACUTUE_23330 [Bacillus sp. NA_146.1]